MLSALEGGAVTASAEALLTKEEAARLCRVSVRGFERHVQPRISPVRLGSRVLFFKEDVLRCLEQQRDSSSSVTVAPVRSSSDSPRPVAPTSSPQAREILARLRAR